MGALIGILVFLVIAGFAIASLFVRRHRETDRPATSWQRTDEVFNDPSTNRVVRVWLDEAGGRRYVAEGQRPAT